MPNSYRPRHRAGWNLFLFLFVCLFGSAVVADKTSDEIRALLKDGDAVEALDAVDDALDDKPDDPELLLLQARAMEADGQVKKAERLLKTLIRKYPGSAEAYNNLALLHARQGQLKKAREVLEQGMSSHPTFATLYHNLNGVYEAQAQAEYAKALNLGAAQPKPDLTPLLAMETRSNGQVSAVPVPAVAEKKPRKRIEKPYAPVVVKKTPKNIERPMRAEPAKVEIAATEAVKPGPVESKVSVASLADSDSVQTRGGLRVSKLTLPPIYMTSPPKDGLASPRTTHLTPKVSVVTKVAESKQTSEPAKPAKPAVPVKAVKPAKKPAPKPSPVIVAKVERPKPASVPASKATTTQKPAVKLTAMSVEADKPKAKPKAEIKEATQAGVADFSEEVDTGTSSPKQAVLDWAKAWSAKDSAGYLEAYASDFRAPGGDRGKWAEKRRQRIAKPKWIKVKLDRFKVVPQADGTTAVTAHQNYRSNTFKSTVRKRWVLTLENSEWRILSERVLR